MNAPASKRIYLIAGEASGDLHGSNLVKALKMEDPSLAFRFWGGDLMQQELGKPVKHIKELAFMGFVEVLMNLRTILSNISFCKQDILAFKPDALVLIDYPGFNLRIAERSIITFPRRYGPGNRAAYIKSSALSITCS